MCSSTQSDNKLLHIFQTSRLRNLGHWHVHTLLNYALRRSLLLSDLNLEDCVFFLPVLITTTLSRSSTCSPRRLQCKPPLHRAETLRPTSFRTLTHLTRRTALAGPPRGFCCWSAPSASVTLTRATNSAFHPFQGCIPSSLIVDTHPLS